MREQLSFRLDIRPVHKNLFFEITKCQAVLCKILIDKQILDKVFCSNVVPSGNHLFSKADTWQKVA